ncbi:hypothetical protein FOCG_18486 [Fusarium oxysporum f. sp. radicis-lycopersici 26381]|nr:hypothetical protein FOCG_18486 [Fusarium oxysporum f. sp. radicis-lycopersici 26381]
MCQPALSPRTCTWPAARSAGSFGVASGAEKARRPPTPSSRNAPAQSKMARRSTTWATSLSPTTGRTPLPRPGGGSRCSTRWATSSPASSR